MMFSECHEQLREKLAARKEGGIIFTAVQKFSLLDGEKWHPALCERQNMVVITDEAHRSQYGLKAKPNTKTGVQNQRTGLLSESFLDMVLRPR